MGDEKVVSNGDLKIDLNTASKQELITAGYVVYERLDKLRAENMAMTSALELIRKRIKDIS